MHQYSDARGGSKENRAGLLSEITESATVAICDDRAGLRLSPLTPFNDIGGANPQEPSTTGSAS